MNNYIKPRLKKLVEHCSIDNKINFFHRPGIAIQLDDPSKFIANVCRVMDGNKTVAEIAKCLSTEYPNETKYIDKLLSVLDGEYLLEDASLNIPNYLTEYDEARWSRNIEFFGSYCKAKDNKFTYQEKLKLVKVAIFGLGGVGSNVLYNLAAMGVSNITAVDCDQVELSNLNRQIIYNESDIGQSKSETAKQRISQFIPQANLAFIDKRISSTEDIDQIIEGHDFVIAAIDHPRQFIMDWFNIACVKHKIPFLCGSLDSRVVVYYTISPGKTGCIECWKFSKQHNDFIFQNLIQHPDFVAANSPNVAIMPLISLVSGFLASEFMKMVTGIAEPHSLGKLCTYDFLNSQLSITEEWSINSTCTVCSKA